MGKPVGSYITIEAPEMAVPDEGYHEEISQQLRKFIGELLPKRKMEKILVVGLGNRQVTPDALGPYVVDNLHITRHIIEEYGKYATGEDEVWSVSAISSLISSYFSAGLYPLITLAMPFKDSDTSTALSRLSIVSPTMVAASTTVGTPIAITGIPTVFSVIAFR